MIADNLQIETGCSGCFSGEFLRYEIRFLGKGAKIKASYSLGIPGEWQDCGEAVIPNERAAEIIKSIVSIFDKPQTPYGGRSTTVYHADVAYTVFHNEVRHQIKTSEMEREVIQEIL